MTRSDKIDTSVLIARNPRVAFHALTEGEGGVLLHLETGAYHGVNSVGLLIWQLLDRQRRFDQLISLLGPRLEDPPAGMDLEVSSYVNDLRARDLISLTREDG